MSSVAGVAVEVILLAPKTKYPVLVPPDRLSLVAREFVMVVEKFASSPSAAASSFSVSRAPGAESTTLDTAVST